MPETNNQNPASSSKAIGTPKVLPPTTTPTNQNYAKNYLLLELADKHTVSELSDLGFDKLNQIGGNIYKAYVKQGQKVEDYLTKAQDKKTKGILTDAYLDYYMTTGKSSVQPSAPQPAPKWYLNQLHIGTALNTPALRNGSPVIAIIDSGVDVTHSEFTGRIYEPFNAFDGSTNVTDLEGHGTSVASVAAGATCGVYPYARIMPIKVADDQLVRDNITNGTSYGTLPFSAIFAGIKYAAAHPEVKVINMSFGGPIPRMYQELIADVLTKRPDLMLIAAAGNEFVSTVSYPAGINGVIAVGATDALKNYPRNVNPQSIPANDDLRLQIMVNGRQMGSNYGVNWVEVAAPGASIRAGLSKDSLYNQTKATFSGDSLNGTSFSSPMVSALSAMLRVLHPNDTVAQITQRIFNTCRHALTDSFQYGVIDVQAAVNTP